MGKQIDLAELRRTVEKLAGVLDGVKTLTPRAIVFGRGGIGQRFREVRRELSLTQAEALSMLDIEHKSVAYLSNWESGNLQSVDIEVLVAAAWVALTRGYSLRWFILGELPKSVSPLQELIPLEQAASAIRMAPEELRRLVDEEKAACVHVGPHVRFTRKQIVDLIIEIFGPASGDASSGGDNKGAQS